MTQHLEEGNWQKIAEQTSTETDSVKLMNLVAKLCHALDDHHEERLASRRQP